MQNTRRPVRSLANALLLTLLLAAAGIVPAGHASDAGGKIVNDLPTIERFGPATANQDEGREGILNGTVRDVNGESDIIKLKISLGDAPGGIAGFDSIAALSPLPTDKPNSFTDGWKVWNAVANDGRIQYEYRYFYPADITGTYTWELEVEDNEGDAKATASVVVGQRLTISDDQVLGDGSSTSGAWGNWTAKPGATNVDSVNYLKIQNTGSSANQQFVLDFSAAQGYLQKSFVGATDGSWEIPIEGNIRFAYWEGPAGSVPDDGTFTHLPVSTSGSHTFSFTGEDNVIFITYRLPALPEVLSRQDYGASFTVTPL